LFAAAAVDAEEALVEEEAAVEVGLVEVIMALLAVLGAPVPVELAAPPTVPRLDAPAISAWTVGLKVPDMPLSVNFAEKASYGKPVAESFKANDVARTKYPLKLGPREALMVAFRVLCWLTSILALSCWSEVCCWTFPA